MSAISAAGTPAVEAVEVERGRRGGPIVGYVTVPAGVTRERSDYIPANQHSEHSLTPGRYAVELVTINYRAPYDGPYGAGRHYYWCATIDAHAGAHVYWSRMPAHTARTELGAHTVTHSGYSFEVENGHAAVWVIGPDGGRMRLPVEVDTAAARAAGLDVDALEGVRMARAFGIGAPAPVIVGVDVEG